MEEWEVCEDFPDYAVSSLGRIEYLEKSRLIPTRINQRGLVMVTIKDPTGFQHTRSVALLVAQTFVEKPKHDWFDSIINLNGDRTDCRAINLMWRSRPFALRYHAMFLDEPYRVSVVIPSKDEFYYSLRECCTTYGLIERKAYINMISDEPCFPYTWKIERARE